MVKSQLVLYDDSRLEFINGLYNLHDASQVLEAIYGPKLSNLIYLSLFVSNLVLKIVIIFNYLIYTMQTIVESSIYISEAFYFEGNNSKEVGSEFICLYEENPNLERNGR